MRGSDRHTSFNWLIAGPMLFFSFVGIAWSRRSEGWWHEVAMNTAFMCLGVLVTVFWVEIILQQKEDREWAGPKAIVDIRLRRAAARFLRTAEAACGTDPYHSRFFVPAWLDRVDPLDSLRQLHGNEAWIEYLKEEVIPASRSLENIQDPMKIDSLINGLCLYRERILEATQFSQGRMSPLQITNVAYIVDDIRVQLHYLHVRKSGNPSYLGPLLKNILERSVSLVEESNRNPDARLPIVEEQNAV